MKKFSSHSRHSNIKKMQELDFDLVIIGGGINGAGAAREASLRGMKVALIEARDFASGTSSKSSKLIHGGLRYLENLDFKLVFEALNERTKLFEMAPHLVHPLRFLIPLYETSRVSMFTMGLGMWLYDALALFQTPEMHERLSSEETLKRMPILAANKLVGSFVYSDAYMDDDRLVLETLRSAHDHGAVCANYVKATGASFNSDGCLNGIEVTDTLATNPQPFMVRGKHFISTVGPWTDLFGEKLFQDWKKILRPTKGIHLTFSKARLPLTSAVVMAAENSSRIVFGIPRHEMVIVGTTDTDYSGSPELVATKAADVDYLLDITRQYFPGGNLTKSDIIASYAGVRPLVKDDSSTEGKTSREHTIINDPRGVTFVAGGKYTTYRLMAEQVVEGALKYFSIEERVQFKKTDSAIALNPWTDPESYDKAHLNIDQYCRTSLLKKSEIQKLVARFGTEVEEFFHHKPETLSYWQLEAYQAIENTMCLNLIDFYTRRTPLFLSEPDHGISALPEISKVFQEALGLSDAELENQVQSLKSFIQTELTW
jgi:glycerol-3-phosphate dehydrogenase